MNKCALCGKWFGSDESEFGLGCLKRLCLSMNIEDIKNYNEEKKLDKEVCNELGKGNFIVI